jgi:RNA polymerase sigma-70 factor (ECF subfamily)
MLRDHDAAEDVVQGVFIRIWKNIDSIQLKASIKSYLFQSAKNATIDHVRKNKKHAAESLENVDIASEDDTVNFDEEADNHLLRQKILEAIELLKPKTREIFKLHKFEGLTYPEIADHLKIPQRTVEYNIYTAIQQLKVRLSDTVKVLSE